MHFLLHPIASLNHLVARLVTDKFTFFISIAFFIYLSLNYKNRLWQEIDERVSKWTQASRENFIQRHAEDLALFGNALFHILYSIILGIIFFVILHEPKTAISIFFALIFSWGFNRFVKLVYKRERPRHLAGNVRKRLSYSFPSGHIMASIGIYFFSAVILQSKITFLPWYLIALVFVLSVILTRVYLRHHYFTDVLAGIALGIFCLNISIGFYFFLSMIWL